MNRHIYLSYNSDKLLKQETEKAIKLYKTDTVTEPLIMAIIKKESGFYPFAFRFEPHLKNVSWYKSALRGIAILNDFHYCSYGLMQILYAVARSSGFKGPVMDLFYPDNNIKYGVIYLEQLFKRFKLDMLDVISSYNQGHPGKDKYGKYYNQAYVDDVLKFYEQYGGK